jgi:hypothetical protein
MNGTLSRPAILVVDEDLGFIFWLGEIAEEIGCTCIPALNCWDAISFIRTFDLEIDLLIVNLTLAGVAEMIQTLTREQCPFQIVSSAQKMPNFLLERADQEPVARKNWIQLIKCTLGQIEHEFCLSKTPS